MNWTPVHRWLCLVFDTKSFGNLQSVGTVTALTKQIFLFGRNSRFSIRARLFPKVWWSSKSIVLRLSHPFAILHIWCTLRTKAFIPFVSFLDVINLCVCVRLAWEIFQFAMNFCAMSKIFKIKTITKEATSKFHYKLFHRVFTCCLGTLDIEF